MELTTREAAERLGVNQSRVRALVAAGTLDARRVGTQWHIDAASVDRQAAFGRAAVVSRPMTARVAWAAAALADGQDVGWLAASERSRLRKRLAGAGRVELLQRWLTTRSTETLRFRVTEADLAALLDADGVVRTGVSAVNAYGLGLGTGGSGDAYVTREIADRLVRDYFLIEGRSGNLTLRIVDHDFHLQTARVINGDRAAPRLIVGVDLADGLDTRTRSVGRSFVSRVLDENQDRRERTI